MVELNLEKTRSSLKKNKLGSNKNCLKFGSGSRRLDVDVEEVEATVTKKSKTRKRAR